MSETNPQRVFLFEEIVTVRWGDMDAFGHVNNTMYFRYFEQCRVNWLANIDSDDDFINGEFGPVIINTGATFLKPIVFPATVIVRMYGGQPGNSSFLSSYDIVDQQDESIVYCQGEAKVVWVDHAAGKSTPLPETLKNLLVGH